MPKHYYDDDYYLTGMDKAGNLLGGMGTGATSGAAIGSAIGTILPGPGNVIGGTIGGVVGAGAGLVAGGLQNKADQQALTAAMKRDAELEREIDEVDHFAPYLEAINARTVGKEQQAGIRSRQAAARGGLSHAAQEDIAGQSIHQAGIERGSALASAVPAAAQADIAEKNRILQEEFGRQGLLDAATSSQDILGAFGSVAAGATALSQIKQSPDTASSKDALVNTGVTLDIYGSDSVESLAGTLGEGSGLFGRSASGRGLSEYHQNRINDPRMDVPITDLDPRIDLSDEEITSIQATEQGARKLEMARGTADYGLQAELNAGAVQDIQRGALGKMQWDGGKVGEDVHSLMKTANERIQLDIQAGVVSQEDFEAIVTENPQATLNVTDWRNAVSNYRRKRRADRGMPEVDGLFASPDAIKVAEEKVTGYDLDALISATERSY